MGLPIPVHAADVARAVRQTGHSSFPVYDDDLDHLIGILFVNDLFRSGWELDARNGSDANGDERRARQAVAARHLPPSAPALSRAREPLRARRPGRHAPRPTGLRRRRRRVRRGGGRAHRQGPPRPRWSGTSATSSTPAGSPRSSGSTAPAGSSTAGPASTTSATSSGWTSPRASTSPWGASSSTPSGTSPKKASADPRRLGAPGGRDGQAAGGQGRRPSRSTPTRLAEEHAGDLTPRPGRRRVSALPSTRLPVASTTLRLAPGCRHHGL